MTNRQVDRINKQKQQQKLKYNRFLSCAHRKKMKIKIKRNYLFSSGLRLFTFFSKIAYFGHMPADSIYKE